MSVMQHNTMPWTDEDQVAPLSGLSLRPTGLPVMYMGREICADLGALASREWLVTNGIGGYAGGALAGCNTRGYHGLLVAALDPPVGRTLLLAGLVETLEIGDRSVPLSTIPWKGGSVAPAGWKGLSAIKFEGTVPTWRFAGPGYEIEKSVFMDHGANVTRIDYRIIRADAPLRLRVDALSDFRDYHSRSFAGGPPPQLEASEDRLCVSGPNGPASLLHLTLDGATATVAPEFYLGFDLAKERTRGLTDSEDHLRAGWFDRVVTQGEVVQFVASAGRYAAPDAMARTKALARESTILSEFRAADVSRAFGGDRATAAAAHGWHGVGGARAVEKPHSRNIPAWVARLALAADQFVVRRGLHDGQSGHSVIAGYHWFADWGRDTMISLPGLTHMCGRPEIAASVLRAFADAIDGGMIPNRFTDNGEAPEYNTVDATFWFVEAIRTHWRMTGDEAFLREMFSLLAGIVSAMETGTRYGIGVAEDGLIRAGEPGVQLTWMDAKVGDWVVTPRIGKPIEVNALWISNLSFMVEAAPLAGADPAPYVALLAKAQAAFERFWNVETGYAYDVIDGPDGDDPTLRPNQILAALTEVGVFDADRRRAIVEVCERELLTPAGLRSLAPGQPDYRPTYGGDQVARDSAYHQGTVWAWLIGPFVEAHLDVHGDPDRAAAMLAPFADQLGIEAIGTIGEIFEADAPHAPRGCVAQAWSVGEVLRAWRLIAAHRAGG